MSLHAQSNQRLEVDDRVETADGQRGTVKYIGQVLPLGEGYWVGVDLDDPVENGNNGTIDGEHYFDGRPKHGTFIPYESAHPISNSILPQTYNNYYTDPSNASNSEFEQTKNRLSRKIDRRPSMKDIEMRGIVPPDYFNDPKKAERRKTLTHELAAFALEDFLPKRQTTQDIEESGIVPKQYFEDPDKIQHQKKLVREMVEHNLKDFVGNRPTKAQIAKQNILPTEYANNDDVREASKKRQSHRRELSQSLDNKIGRRPTITDLGEMHIIPHDYLDRLVQEATIHHKRDPSRLEHMKGRLEKHLPQPVAEALAGSLLNNLNTKEQEKQNNSKHKNDDSSENFDDSNFENSHSPNNLLTHTTIEEEDDDSDNDVNYNGNHNKNRNNNNNNKKQNASRESDDENENNDNDNMNDNDDDDDERAKYDSNGRSVNDNFVPLNPAEKERVKSNLTRRLSRRASQDQIEIWGYVPPDYFDNPQKSVMAQTIGREMAVDVLESFYPKRPELSELTNRGMIHPDYIKKDVNEAREAEQRRRMSLKEDLNEKLNPKKRMSVAQLAEAGYIPESWLLDLYGLADVVRRKHNRMESAVADLEKQLNVPAVLAGAVATDILTEIEGVDPVLTSKQNQTNQNQQNGNKHNNDRQDRNERNDSNENVRNKRGSIDLQPRIDTEALREAMEKEITAKVKAEYEEYLRQGLDQMKAQTEAYREQVDENTKANNSRMIEKMTQLSNELENTKNEYNRMINELMTIRNENEQLRKENQSLQSSVDSIRQHERKYINRIEELENEMDSKTEMENKMEKMRATVNDLRNDKKVLSANCAEEMNKLRNYIVALEKRNASMSSNSSSAGNSGSSWSFGLFG